MSAYPHLGAFESTKIYGSGLDVLETTRHTEFWEADLTRLYGAGITELRYPVPWHSIESEQGRYDWRWMDGPMQLMQDLGMRPILDPLHHVSVPDWLTDGFANPEFPNCYSRFVENVARRYEWVDRYTVVNEPLPTLVLSGLTGDWHPNRRSDRDFVTMAVNVSRAICLATAVLKNHNPKIQLIHVDSCEHHRALDAGSLAWVEHANRRRFLFHDLVLGQVDEDYRMLPYLRANGFTDDHRYWFEDNACWIDVIGLDYYAHSEMDWGWNPKTKTATLRFPCEKARGFCAVACDYVSRFRLPVLLSETNIGGSVRDRITWLKFMEEQAEKLSAVCDFRGFCWFPSIDATDWDSLCTVANRNVCPMGVWSLSQDCGERQTSELSELYTRLAKGTASSSDLPAYRFTAPLNQDLRGYQHLMADWRWLCPTSVEAP